MCRAVVSLHGAAGSTAHRWMVITATVERADRGTSEIYVFYHTCWCPPCCCHTSFPENSRWPELAAAPICVCCENSMSLVPSSTLLLTDIPPGCVVAPVPSRRGVTAPGYGRSDARSWNSVLRPPRPKAHTTWPRPRILFIQRLPIPPSLLLPTVSSRTSVQVRQKTAIMLMSLLSHLLRYVLVLV